MVRKNAKGFTLIEVLIAVLITGVILTALLSTLRAGVLAYKRLDEISGEIHQVRLFMTLLENEFRNMLFYSEGPFTGAGNQFSFSTLADEYEEDRVNKVPVMVNYEYRDKALYSKEAALRGLFTEKKETSKKIIPSLKSFTVQYAYRKEDNPENMWVGAWSKDRGLPRGVQIILVFDRKTSKKAAGAEEFMVRRKFFIPQGSWGWIA